MLVRAVHHVAIATQDLERSLASYSGILGLKPAPRPSFPVDGAWLDMGSTQVHLAVHPEATFRTKASIDNNDCHFALRVENFDAALDHLIRHGYAENAPDGSGRKLLVKRHSPAGYPQVYVLDPDGHVVEINASS
ncbi:VOC family protein [Microvirga pudoricolor]|uniref:VOC family protein n=1 Tax=Microvirga pudoricolor TaxID=2778729 RepID=UPI0019517141|nr:VOC family protein [Microvirga pudoricolor]MBM6593745.1 VOC family protein [Microvirga pudoricolor]